MSSYEAVRGTLQSVATAKKKDHVVFSLFLIFFPFSCCSLIFPHILKLNCNINGSTEHYESAVNIWSKDHSDVYVHFEPDLNQTHPELVQFVETLQQGPTYPL